MTTMTTMTTPATKALSRTDDLPLGRRVDPYGRMHGDAGSLTEKSWQQLKKFEAVVDKGLVTWFEVGRALVAIQKRKLYKIDCRTFAAYCKKRFHITSRRAYQLIDASAVAANVNPGSQKTLTSERQARPLTKLDPADQQVVWDEAVETAPNGKVTAKHVEQVVSKRVSDSVPKRVERKEYPPCMAKQFADLAIGQLDQIKPDDAERLQAFDQVEEWIKARRDECP